MKLQVNVINDILINVNTSGFIKSGNTSLAPINKIL